MRPTVSRMATVHTIRTVRRSRTAFFNSDVALPTAALVRVSCRRACRCHRHVRLMCTTHTRATSGRTSEHAGRNSNNRAFSAANLRSDLRWAAMAARCWPDVLLRHLALGSSASGAILCLLNLLSPFTRPSNLARLMAEDARILIRPFPDGIFCSGLDCLRDQNPPP